VGETYLYEIELSDLGPTDELQLELTEGPDGMLLEALEGNHWVLKWAVPADHEGGTTDVALRATDGHFTDEGWVPDGGEVWQRFRIQVTGDLDPMFEMDAYIPEPDATPSLDNYGGEEVSCDATGANHFEFIFFGFVFLGLLRRRRRL